MGTGMVAGLAVALWLDRWLRQRRGKRPARQRARPVEPPSREAGAVPPEPAHRADAGVLPAAVLSGERDLSDEELVARVQAQVGIPRGVEVTAVEGAVVLFGRVPRFAFAALLSRVARVPGVVDVEDRLTPVDDLGAEGEV